MHPGQITIRQIGIGTTILHKPHSVMGIRQSQTRAKILLGIENTDSLMSLDCLSSVHSLEEYVPSTRKAVDHFLDDYERPTHKRHTSAFWNGKNQSLQDPIHSDLRQAQTLSFVCGFSKSSIPKKRTLVRMYAIKDLSAQEEGPLGHFSRAHEGLDIASITKPSVRAEKQMSENFLEQDKGRVKCKASDVPSGSSPLMPKRLSWSRLSVIADQIVLSLRTEVSTVQPLPSCWPFPNELVLKILEDMPTQDLRSTLFRAPKYLRCNLLNVDDRHLQALSSFIELLGSNSSLFVSIVKDGEMLGDFAPLFQSIRDSGCKSLRFLDQWASHLAYPPLTLPDFVAAPDLAITNNFHIFHANSPIFFSRSMVALTLSSLQSSSLSVLQWTVLMRDIHFPHLRFLSIDVECPATALVEFLTRHGIHQLWLYSMRPEIVSLDGMDLTQNVTTPAFPYIACALSLDRTDHLRLSFYDGSLISQSFDVSLGEYRTIPVKNLTIFLPHWYKYSDRHPLSLATSLPARREGFLRPGDMTASERQELEAAYRHPENPYCLDIGHFM
ncbi:uncharacterized protein F5147DRAFT_657281 [Suillus discolor]|uniref:Uncharacterized protein n=1 Tax=Suillus discolor TaxID=1912936 RepID=A0A9P7EXQ7_9AGAM|nr:uncharacterized protein F5147DRAFT_657281 [Suillus discolor]KAG2094038.1 hypothetical protein F5147DRAFT_657281 [Suillus discolor]